MIDKVISFFLPGGFVKVVFAFASFVLFLLLDADILSYITFAILIYLVVLYRDPRRNPPDISSSALLSPADGVVEDIIEDGKYYTITISSMLYSNAILASPCKAKVSSIKLYRGARLPVKSPLFKELNEALFVTFESEKYKVELEHRLQRSPFEIYTNLRGGIELDAGEVYATAVLARSVVKIPKDFRIYVKKGSKVYAAHTILGYFSS
jgi:hypothetical protein